MKNYSQAQFVDKNSESCQTRSNKHTQFSEQCLLHFLNEKNRAAQRYEYNIPPQLKSAVYPMFIVTKKLIVNTKDLYTKNLLH